MARPHRPLPLSSLLAVALASSAPAAQASSCLDCHLDEARLVGSLSGATARKSAMQSGAG